VGALPTLDPRSARYDKFRGGVLMAAGSAQVVISHDALENWVNRRLTNDEAVEAAVEEKALLARVANTLAEHDNIITITNGVLNSRSWDIAPGDEE